MKRTFSVTLLLVSILLLPGMLAGCAAGTPPPTNTSTLPAPSATTPVPITPPPVPPPTPTPTPTLPSKGPDTQNSANVLLKVDHVKQLPDYCGEACYSMAACYLGRPSSQEQVHAAGGKNLSRGLYGNELMTNAQSLGLVIGQYWEQYASREEVSKYVDHSLDRIKIAIRQGKPVMAGWYALTDINKSYLGHFILVVGFNETERYLYVHDPGKESGPDKVTFDDFRQHHAMPTVDYGNWGLFLQMIELAPSAASTSTTPSRSVKLTDPADDLFDKAGNPIRGELYLDIVQIWIASFGSYYDAKITLNAPLPDKTPEPSAFMQWDIYVDADRNALTGESWPLVANDLGFEYFVRLMLLDSTYTGEVHEFGTGFSQSLVLDITSNVIEFRWLRKTDQPDAFNFVATAKKYGERGKASAFILGDKVPNQLHATFP